MTANPAAPYSARLGSSSCQGRYDARRAVRNWGEAYRQAMLSAAASERLRHDLERLAGVNER